MIFFPFKQVVLPLNNFRIKNYVSNLSKKIYSKYKIWKNLKNLQSFLCFINWKINLIHSALIPERRSFYQSHLKLFRERLYKIAIKTGSHFKVPTNEMPKFFSSIFISLALPKLDTRERDK